MKNLIPKSTIIGLVFVLAGSVNAGVVSIPITKAVPVASVDSTKVEKYLVKFDLSSIPQGSTIDLVEMNLKVEVDTGKKYVDLAIFPVTGDWSEDAILLTENQVSYTDTILTTETIDATTGKIVDLNITRIVTEWFKGTLPNKGLMIAPLEDDFDIKNLSAFSGVLQNVVAEAKIFYTAPEVKK